MDMYDTCDYCHEGPFHLYRVRAVDGSDEWICADCREDVEKAATHGQIVERRP